MHSRSLEGSLDHEVGHGRFLLGVLGVLRI